MKERLGGRRAALSFSGGKDSLATWMVLRDAGVKLVPVYHYDLPGLAFVEDYLARCEEHFRARIVRIPHVRLYQYLGWQAFQPPHRVPLLEAFDHPTDCTLGELKKLALADHGMPDPWIAVGTRATDSTSRSLVFRSYGPIREGQKAFFPIWDWRKAQVFQKIADDGLELSKDYEIWGRSFDGLDYRYLAGIRKHYPEDYLRILEAFPLMDLEFARKEIADGERARKEALSASR